MFTFNFKVMSLEIILAYMILFPISKLMKTQEGKLNYVKKVTNPGTTKYVLTTNDDMTFFKRT